MFERVRYLFVRKFAMTDAGDWTGFEQAPLLDLAATCLNIRAGKRDTSAIVDSRRSNEDGNLMWSDVLDVPLLRRKCMYPWAYSRPFVVSFPLFFRSLC